MRAHAGLVLFIGAMILAAITVGVFHTTTSEASSSPGGAASSATGSASQPVITSVSVYGVAEGSAAYATVEVQGGSQPLNVSDLSLRLQTSGGSQTHTVVE